MIFNVGAGSGSGNSIEILTQIRVLVSEDYIGQTVACTNEYGTFLKDVDSSLIVTFDVSFGDWQIFLDDLEENVSVYYYGIHNVDLRPEPDNVALISTHTSTTSGSGIVSVSTKLSDSYFPYNSVDGNNSQDSWCSKSGYPQWWQYQFYVPKVVKKFKFSGDGDNVKTFKLQGSNDGIEWTDLGTYVNTVTTSFTYVEYSVNNRKSYSYYRLYFMDGHTNCASIEEIQMYGYERL